MPAGRASASEEAETRRRPTSVGRAQRRGTRRRRARGTAPRRRPTTSTNGGGSSASEPRRPAPASWRSPVSSRTSRCSSTPATSAADVRDEDQREADVAEQQDRARSRREREQREEAQRLGLDAAVAVLGDVAVERRVPREEPLAELDRAGSPRAARRRRRWPRRRPTPRRARGPRPSPERRRARSSPTRRPPERLGASVGGTGPYWYEPGVLERPRAVLATTAVPPRPERRELATRASHSAPSVR